MSWGGDVEDPPLAPQQIDWPQTQWSAITTTPALPNSAWDEPETGVTTNPGGAIGITAHNAVPTTSGQAAENTSQPSAKVKPRCIRARHAETLAAIDDWIKDGKKVQVSSSWRVNPSKEQDLSQFLDQEPDIFKYRPDSNGTNERNRGDGLTLFAFSDLPGGGEDEDYGGTIGDSDPLEDEMLQLPPLSRGLGNRKFRFTQYSANFDRGALGAADPGGFYDGRYEEGTDSNRGYYLANPTMARSNLPFHLGQYTSNYAWDDAMRRAELLKTRYI